MKVLHILYDNIFSGAQNVVCQIIDLYKTYEPDTEMVYVSPDGPIREALDARGIRFHALEKWSVGSVKKVIDEEKPDLIHAHDMRASVAAALASGSVPVISHIHNNNYNSRGLSLKSIIYGIAALKVKHIFWVSKSSYEGFKFSKCFEEKSSVLYNVIDCGKIHEHAEAAEIKAAYDIVYVGRLTYQKNPERLIKVFAKVAMEKTDATFAIVGDGELKEQLEKLVLQLPPEIRGRISLLGYQKNPYGIMEKAKVMLMTSRWEGTPMCILEAQEFGLPVVSTPSDGIADIIVSGENGFLEKEDDELAQRCLLLLRDASKRADMSRRAHDFSVRYNDVKAYFDRINDAYHEALGNSLKIK